MLHRKIFNGRRKSFHIGFVEQKFKFYYSQLKKERVNMLRKWKIWIHFFLFAIIVGCASHQVSTIPAVPGDFPHFRNWSGNRVQNIILFIGDGMGIQQVAATRIATMGPDGRLAIDKMPVTGLITTHSADNLITDSAAGATAMSTGVKTRNGMIGMNPDTVAYRTILELAKQRGKSTGLVVTSSIAHATPAGFGAHVPSRKMQDKIAEQLLHNKIEVLLGGGKKYFIPQSMEGSGRTDEKNLLSLAQQLGYTIVENKTALQKVQSPYVLGLFAMDGLTTQPPEPSLAEMTRKALDILSQDADGFFLMVEGSQIDWGGHANDLKKVIRQTQLFDEAVQVGIQFAQRNGNTLVVIVADHETGGLTIVKGNPDGSNMEVAWVTHHHTGQPVPVYALGPYSRLFSGVHDNTFIPRVFATLWHIQPFPQPVVQ